MAKRSRTARVAPPSAPVAAASSPANELEVGGKAAPLLLALLFLLAPALGAPGDLLVQDTVKSAFVAFAALLAALLLFAVERRQGRSLRWHAVLWLPLLLAAYALGSMLWSHPYLAGVEAVRWFLFALLAWLGLNLFTPARLPWLAAGVHAGAVLASVWAAGQFWFDLAWFGQGPPPGSTFGNRNFFAEFAACAWPFGALLLARARTTPAILLLSTSLGLVLTAVFMTGTRSALVALVLVVLLLAVMAWRCRAQLAFSGWRPARRALAVAGFVVPVLVLGLLPSGNPRIVQEGYGTTPLARALHRAKAIQPGDDSFNVRLELWGATLRAIADRPLTGVGAGAWENAIPVYQQDGSPTESDYYAHDEFLQLVAEYGVVGWIFLLLLAAWLAQAAWRSWRARGVEADAERPWRAMFLASLLALLVVSAVGFPWRLAMTGALFAVCIGGLAASDARLGASRRLLRVVAWRPAFANLALAATAACLVLAVYVTSRAVAAEGRLLAAARSALAITASGEPNDPRFTARKKRMLQLVEEGTAINPHYRKITPIVADELARWGDWASAVRIWEGVLASRPNAVAILLNAAKGHDVLGQREQASALLKQAQRVQPNAPSVRSLEVLMLARGGEEKKALARAQEAIDQGLADYELVNTAYVLALRAGDYPRARDLLQQRMDTWPESRPHGLVQMGQLYDQAFHEPDKALAAFRDGLASAASQRERLQFLEEIPSSYKAQLAAAPQTSASSK